MKKKLVLWFLLADSASTAIRNVKCNGRQPCSPPPVADGVLLIDDAVKKFNAPGV
jgi:hypothetical protein